MADGTVAHQREMGRLGKADAVRATLDKDRAEMLAAIGRAKFEG